MSTKQSEAFHLDNRQPQTAGDDNPNDNIALHVSDGTKDVARTENTYRMQPLVKIEVFIIRFSCHKNKHREKSMLKMDN